MIAVHKQRRRNFSGAEMSFSYSYGHSTNNLQQCTKSTTQILGICCRKLLCHNFSPSIYHCTLCCCSTDRESNLIHSTFTKETINNTQIAVPQKLERLIHKLQKVFSSLFPNKIIFSFVDVQLNFLPSDNTSSHIRPIAIRGGGGIIQLLQF